MPAPAGFKTFVAGAVLSATSDVQVYLMDQVCTVWNDASARTSGLGSPAEGQISYLKDTDSVEVYDGASWTAVGGTFTWTGSTANGLATYGSSTTVVAESTATYDGTTLELTQSGGGLKMDGLASADANTLDDYEEGEWNPTFVCGTSGTITATNDTFSYTKVGRMVNVQGRASTFTVSSPSGLLTIGSLPFAIADTTEMSERGSFSVVAMGLVYDRNNIMGYYVAGSALSINYGNGLMGTGGSNMAGSIDAGSILIINATYCAAT